MMRLESSFFFFFYPSFYKKTINTNCDISFSLGTVHLLSGGGWWVLGGGHPKNIGPKGGVIQKEWLNWGGVT